MDGSCHETKGRIMKAVVFTLGCKVNSYEIEAIKDDLLELDYIQVNNEKDADIIIINTCCVTNTAASKSRQKINSLHKSAPSADIIVMGCYVQGFEEEVKKIEGVKLLVGTLVLIYFKNAEISRLFSFS